MQNYMIAPSILSADLARLGDEVNAVLNAGADMIHFDVMDNHYVPNLTFGPLICQSLRKYGITAPIDVHLMVKPVDELIKSFAAAGANYITFHPEASDHIDRSLQLIRQLGCSAGLVLNPATPLAIIEHVLDKLDMILIMSVNPGFAGQKFIRSVLPKIVKTREIIDQHNLATRLEVDGGIDIKNIEEVAQAGADTFVSGSTIFNSNNYKKTISAMRNALNNVQSSTQS